MRRREVTYSQPAEIFGPRGRWCGILASFSRFPDSHRMGFPNHTTRNLGPRAISMAAFHRPGDFWNNLSAEIFTQLCGKPTALTPGERRKTLAPKLIRSLPRVKPGSTAAFPVRGFSPLSAYPGWSFGADLVSGRPERIFAAFGGLYSLRIIQVAADLGTITSLYLFAYSPSNPTRQSAGRSSASLRYFVNALSVG